MASSARPKPGFSVWNQKLRYNSGVGIGAKIFFKKSKLLFFQKHFQAIQFSLMFPTFLGAYL